MAGINASVLIKSGEPLPVSRAPSRAPSCTSNIETDPKRDEPMRAPVGHLTEMECQPPRKPQGTGDDPFGVDDLESEVSLMIANAGVRLEGILPDRYEGDRSKTMSFLTQFKRFMLMNHNTVITCDPCAKAAFFLSLIGGPKVEGWIQCTYDWLDDVEADPSLLPFKMNAWQALEAKFKKMFIDYTAHERAQDELRKLRMKEGNIDEYIAAFQLLGHHAGLT
jgi:Retrotransposon gag protein